MSRIGKHPAPVPSGVEVQVAGQVVKAKGKLGQREITLTDDVDVALEDNAVVVRPRGPGKRARAMWGSSRSLVNNMIRGVSEGFKVDLEIVGVGYRAAVQGQNLQLQLGFSHDVVYPIPDDITIACARPTAITISGVDKQRVGQVASKIRAFRPPEPYKGKGVKYANEVIVRKEGKKK